MQILGHSAWKVNWDFAMETVMNCAFSAQKPLNLSSFRFISTGIRRDTCRMLGVLFAAIGVILSGSNGASAQESGNYPSQAQKQVVKYLAELGNLHCKETVIQEKLATNGHVQATEHSTFDYLVMIDGTGDDFQLNESRLETKSASHKPLPMLVTNGFSTLLLIFHPYFSGAFDFEPGPDETIDGRNAVSIHFKHIRGRRSLAALALRSREYPLELQGTAWIDKKTGQVLRIDATLEDEMSDIGLRSLNIRVNYSLLRLGATTGSMTLPTLATVEVTTPRQHWRNTHAFSEYKVFGAEAEQDPNVKLKAENRDETIQDAPAGPIPSHQ